MNSIFTNDTYTELNSNPSEMRAAIYAGVILGTKMRSLENTGFHWFNPKFIA